MTDNVNHPAHYLANAITLEPIELTARLNSCLGQACQYVCRAGLKGDEVEDLQKAVFYLNKQIEINEDDRSVVTIWGNKVVSLCLLFSEYAQTKLFKNFLQNMIMNLRFDKEDMEFYITVTKENLERMILLLESRIEELQEAQ